MRKIQVTVPHPEVHGDSIDRVIEVEDDYAARVVGQGQGTYVDEVKEVDAGATAAVPDDAVEDQATGEPQPATAVPVPDGDPATRVRRAAKADAPAE